MPPPATAMHGGLQSHQASHVTSAKSSLPRPQQRRLGRPVAHRRKALAVHSSGGGWGHVAGTAVPPLGAGWAAAAAAGLLLLCAPAGAKEVVQGYPRVVDGDTLEINGTRVRLYGIDAPETKQACSVARSEYACGESARAALMKKVGSAPVLCEQKNRDKYGRVVGVCSLVAPGRAPLDLNAWMVKEGWAVAYRQYSKAYAPLEDLARTQKKGIWAGQFDVPERWRIDHPRTAKGKGAPAAAEAAQVAAARPPPLAPAPTAAQPASRAAAPTSRSSSSNSSSSAAVAVAQAAAGGVAPARLAPNPDCAIKGNISQKGERVYHIPGGKFYDRTVIEVEKGERWFCSAAQAEAAGWRPAQQ